MGPRSVDLNWNTLVYGLCEGIFREEDVHYSLKVSDWFVPVNEKNLWPNILNHVRENSCILDLVLSKAPFVRRIVVSQIQLKTSFRQQGITKGFNSITSRFKAAVDAQVLLNPCAFVTASIRIPAGPKVRWRTWIYPDEGYSAARWESVTQKRSPRATGQLAYYIVNLSRVVHCSSVGLMA
jgi:hypothetical protein